MRQSLISLLMFVMFMPSLACGNLMFAKKAQAAQETPCHGNVQKSNADEATMLFKDCARIDLSHADHGNTIQKPEIQIDKVFYALIDLSANSSFTPVRANQIRGPPIIAAASETYPPLYLTTQRLRI